MTPLSERLLNGSLRTNPTIIEAAETLNANAQEISELKELLKISDEGRNYANALLEKKSADVARLRDQLQSQSNLITQCHDLIQSLQYVDELDETACPTGMQSCPQCNAHPAYVPAKRPGSQGVNTYPEQPRQ